MASICPNCGKNKVYLFNEETVDSGRFHISSVVARCQHYDYEQKYECGYVRYVSRKRFIPLPSRMVYDNSEYLEAKAKLPQPDGEHCVICGKELPKYKKKYCSDECFLAWARQFHTDSWSSLRSEVIRESNFRCAKCGFQVADIPSQWECFAVYPEFLKGERYCCPAENMFVVDHIRPVALGGKEFDKSNLQVLCEDCNKIKTKNDLVLISKKRNESIQHMNPFEVSIRMVTQLCNTLDSFYTVISNCAYGE